MRNPVKMFGKHIGDVQDMNRALGLNLEKPYRGSVYGIAPKYKVHVMDFDDIMDAYVFVEQCYIGTYIAL